MKPLKSLKVALVHDFLNQFGGAERVLETLTEMFPQAPIYTLIYDPEKMRGKFNQKKIRTSFLQKFPKFLRKRYRYFLPLLPTAPETFDLRDFDLVISSSGAWSKGIVTRLDTLHIAYIHSPMRFVWDYNEKYLKEEHQTKWNFLARPILNYIRLWDYLAADRPDYLIANSQYTQERIKKYYRKESKIIYPPCSIKGKADSILKTKSSKPLKKYFLIVSRLSAYKNIEIVVKVFNRLQLPLVIAGEGKESRRLKKIAKKNVKFMGWVEEDKLAQLYLGARAFIFPSLDDFGIAPVEAMGWGVPVLALKKGGAKEIVEEGKTGEFFKTVEVKAIVETLKKFMQNEDKYDKNYIRQSAQKFSSERFKKELTHFIENLYN